MGPILTHGSVKLLNVPEAEAVIGEIYLEDCYHLNEIPDKSIVFDIGAFYGEFGLKCFKEKQCCVMAYEPCRDNFDVLIANELLNCGINGFKPSDRLSEYLHFNAGIAGKNEGRDFHFWPEHPGGSSFTGPGKPCRVQCVVLKDQIALARLYWGKDRPICVKMDCEGAETEIFEDLSWIDSVHIVTMEWHNYDGHIYAEHLRAKGFEVIIEGGGPPPRPVWDETIGAGLLFAKRKE